MDVKPYLLPSLAATAQTVKRAIKSAFTRVLIGSLFEKIIMSTQLINPNLRLRMYHFLSENSSSKTR